MTNSPKSSSKRSPKRRQGGSKSSGRDTAKRLAASSVRVIGGSLRGSKIEFVEADGLRPTSDRIRETLFNWLAPHIAGARCMDLFAGSGVLTFEALSRGAGEVYALEKNKAVYQSIRANQQRLNVGNLQLINTDSLIWLAECSREQRFDIVFVDPPFHAGIGSDSLNMLQDSGILSPEAIVYLEQPKSDDGWPVPSAWELLREKTAGQVNYSLYQAD